MERIKTWVIVILVGSCVLVGLDAWEKSIELNEAKLVYEHPKVVQSVRVVQGPVRIVTRVIERPGEKEMVVVEERGQVTAESRQESTPEPLASILKPVRTDRWLLGLSLHGPSPSDAGSYRVLAGYSFKNRLDLFAGVGYDETVKTEVSLMARF